MEHYKAAMLLSGAGDALGCRNGLWEHNESGPAIHQVGPGPAPTKGRKVPTKLKPHPSLSVLLPQELRALGGLASIKAEPPDWPLSADTLLHLATAEGLATGGLEMTLAPMQQLLSLSVQFVSNARLVGLI